MWRVVGLLTGLSARIRSAPTVSGCCRLSLVHRRVREVRLYVADVGEREPTALIHGWLLSDARLRTDIRHPHVDVSGSSALPFAGLVSPVIPAPLRC